MGICQRNLFQLKSVNTNLQRSNDDYNCTLGGAKKTCFLYPLNMTIQLLTCCGPSKKLRSCCVMCFPKRWYRLFLLWRDQISEEIWGSIHILHWSSLLFSERSSSCPWTSKHTLLCYASSPERDYMPSRLWCIGIPKLHQRPVAQKSGMFRGEAEVCNREWKVPSYRSSHTGDT